MDELLAILHIGESVAVSVLIWRSLVADRERSGLLTEMREMRMYLQALVIEMLKKTGLRED